MKLLFEAISSTGETGEQDAVLLSLQRLGFLQSSLRLADGAYLVEVDDAVMADLSLFRDVRLKPLE